MIKCQACGSEQSDNSQFCDECGTKLNRQTESSGIQAQMPEPFHYQAANVTSVGIPSIFEEDTADETSPVNVDKSENKNVHAGLFIERGNEVGKEFVLVSDENYIGRWDADNGVFPDVDLDAFDDEAKVSRRHARIVYINGVYTVEDLGSTNGTYVNRGRRLIPGTPHRLNDGDEIIVGKTFLRFYIK
ncbi:MAG: FHA domain-containing protein [Pyrinomonadaceae bacterium]